MNNNIIAIVGLAVVGLLIFATFDTNASSKETITAKPKIAKNCKKQPKKITL